MKIPFSPPYIDEAVINEVVDSLRSGWITSGPKVKALEEEIKSFSGAKEVLCVNSWTSGAIMMLRWLGVKEGDEVIVPAYTYSATALAVLHAGAKPVMVDSGTDFNISVEAVRKAITPKTKAIIPVDIAGFPCDYERITAPIMINILILTTRFAISGFAPLKKFKHTATPTITKYNGSSILSLLLVFIRFSFLLLLFKIRVSGKFRPFNTMICLEKFTPDKITKPTKTFSHETDLISKIRFIT